MTDHFPPSNVRCKKHPLHIHFKSEFIYFSLFLFVSVCLLIMPTSGKADEFSYGNNSSVIGVKGNKMPSRFSELR